jgi:hypothetical protein
MLDGMGADITIPILDISKMMFKTAYITAEIAQTAS